MNNLKKKIFKYVKFLIKKFLFKYNWKLEKIYVQKEPLGPPPSLLEINLLKNCNGIIHFGAHRGQEAEIYEWFRKKVIWIEANPKIFFDLTIKIKQFPNQVAYNHLITNITGDFYNFNISNNDAASSSIFDFGKLSVGKKNLWPNKKLKYDEKIKLKSISIDDFILKNNIDLNNFNHWILDLQGAELLALSGAKNSLKFCKSLVVEVSNGDVYKDAPNFKEIINYLNQFNFININNLIDKHQNLLFKKN